VLLEVPVLQHLGRVGVLVKPDLRRPTRADAAERQVAFLNEKLDATHTHRCVKCGETVAPAPCERCDAAEAQVSVLRRAVELLSDAVSPSNTPESQEWAEAYSQKRTKLSFDEWIASRVLADSWALAAAHDAQVIRKWIRENENNLGICVALAGFAMSSEAHKRQHAEGCACEQVARWAGDKLRALAAAGPGSREGKGGG